MADQAPAKKLFDPRLFGARCDECPLRTRRWGEPCPPEIHEGAKALVIGEAPGEEEVEHCRPFVGRSGQEANGSFATAGFAREELSWINGVQCRPPKNDFNLLLHEIARENKQRRKDGLADIPDPRTCCRPFLLHFVHRHRNIVTLGGKGLQSLVDDFEISPLSIRGGPLFLALARDGTVRWLDGVDANTDATHYDGAQILRVLPTLHPAFVLRRRRWTKVFRADVARAVRWFTGRLGWTPPQMQLFPSVAEIRRFLLEERHAFWSIDYETDDKESLVANVRCLGISTKDRAILIGFRSIDGHAMMSPQDEAEVKQILRQFLLDRTRVKCGHNAGYYDRIVAHRHLGVVPVPMLDTILIHRAVDGELPHNLGFVGSFYTDVTAWKADHTATTAQTDEDLGTYCMTDCVVDARCLEPLLQAAQMRNQMPVLEMDHKIQGVCANMHILGMPVDQVRRAQRERELVQGYQKRKKDGTPLLDGKGKPIFVDGIIQHRARCIAMSGDHKHNPGSYPQVRELLFGKWGFTPDPKDFTELGEPTTSDDVIRKLMFKPGVKPYQYDYLKSLRWYRRLTKYRGTYVAKIKPCTEFIDDDGLLEDEADELEKKQSGKGRGDRKVKERKRGIVLLDGRMHPGWNAHVAVSGRLSSSDPINGQNFPKVLRDIIWCGDGYLFIYADMDQIELRFVSALAGAARYLEVFWNAYKVRGKLKTKADKDAIKLNPKYDPHAATAAMIFGKLWDAANDKDKNKMRDFAKRFAYAVLYGAEPPTVHDVIISSENNDGELIYADMKLSQTRRNIDAWLGANPEIERWHRDVFSEFCKQGYLVEPVLGRRRDFLDGEDDSENEVRNFKPQAGGAAIVSAATLELVDGPLPFFKWGPNTGLINQCHDALLFQVPKDKAEWASGEVQAAMTRFVPGLDVPFTASGKIIERWDEG